MECNRRYPHLSMNSHHCPLPLPLFPKLHPQLPTSCLILGPIFGEFIPNMLHVSTDIARIQPACEHLSSLNSLGLEHARLCCTFVHYPCTYLRYCLVPSHILSFSLRAYHTSRARMPCVSRTLALACPLTCEMLHATQHLCMSYLTLLTLVP